jgi:hypothetical protein
VNIESFEPDAESTGVNENSIDWFSKFKIYQPVMLKLLNTSYSELSSVWNVSIDDIRIAVDSQRLVFDERGDMYINSKACEPQSICYDCRHPRIEESIDDPLRAYLDLLEAA